MRKHLNACIPDELSDALDAAAAERGLDRSKFVRWALGRVLSENEPYIYEFPTLPNWQVEAWTLLLRGLFDDRHLVPTDAIRPLLAEALGKLNERDRQVLRWRFGLDGPRYTLAEVGDMRGIQRERVRQIEGRALRRMWGWLRHSGIWELLEGQLRLEKDI